MSAVDSGAVRDESAEADVGGESACFAHLICRECGVVLDGADHLESCTWVDPEHGLEPMNTVEPSP